MFRGRSERDEPCHRRRGIRRAVFGPTNFPAMIFAAMMRNLRRRQRISMAWIRFVIVFFAVILTIILAFVFAGRGYEGHFLVAILIAIPVATNFVATFFITAAFDIVAAIVLALSIAARVVTGRKDVVPGVVRDDRTSFVSGVTKIGEDVLGLDLALAQCGEVVGNGFFLVETDLAGVGADETLIEDSAGKLVKVFVFQSTEHARADFCGIGDGVEREAALLALLAKFFSERSQGRLRRAPLRLRPHPDENNHRRMRTYIPELGSGKRLPEFWENRNCIYRKIFNTGGTG
jgi:hypothetical protein